MKNYTQVYVKNSVEAARHYCDAFGAKITREFWNADGNAYEHCELSVNGEGFLALAEAKNPCDVALVHRLKWETMTFDVLSDGGVVLQPVGALPWNPCNATVIDKYGVCWWIAI